MSTSPSKTIVNPQWNLAPTVVENHWKIILAGSRFTKDAKSQYAPVEKEALALVYGQESCWVFVLGCLNLLVVVDHQPLVKIFWDQVLKNIKNPHLFNFKEQSLIYKFRIKYIPGKLNITPHCTSRHSASPTHVGAATNDTAQQIDYAIQASIISTYVHNAKLRAVTWERIAAAVVTDRAHSKGFS